MRIRPFKESIGKGWRESESIFFIEREVEIFIHLSVRFDKSLKPYGQGESIAIYDLTLDVTYFLCARAMPSSKYLPWVYREHEGFKLTGVDNSTGFFRNHKPLGNKDFQRAKELFNAATRKSIPSNLAVYIRRAKHAIDVLGENYKRSP